MTCYHTAMRDEIARRAPGYLYPEEARWLVKHGRAGPKVDCAEQPCVHWPIFTVVPGSPYLPYHGPAECYSGFRSDPRPLMGVLRLNTSEQGAATLANQAYLRERLAA